ncbi:hypothetical protein Esti_001318 [Eimeria stiedai]
MWLSNHINWGEDAGSSLRSVHFPGHASAFLRCIFDFLASWSRRRPFDKGFDPGQPDRSLKRRKAQKQAPPRVSPAAQHSAQPSPTAGSQPEVLERFHTAFGTDSQDSLIGDPTEVLGAAPAFVPPAIESAPLSQRLSTPLSSFAVGGPSAGPPSPSTMQLTQQLSPVRSSLASTGKQTLVLAHNANVEASQPVPGTLGTQGGIPQSPQTTAFPQNQTLLKQFLDDRNQHKLSCSLKTSASPRHYKTHSRKHRNCGSAAPSDEPDPVRWEQFYFDFEAEASHRTALPKNRWNELLWTHCDKSATEFYKVAKAQNRTEGGSLTEYESLPDYMLLSRLYKYHPHTYLEQLIGLKTGRYSAESLGQLVQDLQAYCERARLRVHTIRDQEFPVLPMEYWGFCYIQALSSTAAFVVDCQRSMLDPKKSENLTRGTHEHRLQQIQGFLIHSCESETYHELGRKREAARRDGGSCSLTEERAYRAIAEKRAIHFGVDAPRWVESNDWVHHDGEQIGGKYLCRDIVAGTSFDLKAGGWRMRDLGFIRISALEDRTLPISGDGLCQDPSTTGCRHNSAQLSLFVDSHCAAQPRLYCIANDDDMWEREALRALQVDKGDYPDIFDIRTDINEAETTIGVSHVLLYDIPAHHSHAPPTYPSFSKHLMRYCKSATARKQDFHKQSVNK